MVVTGYAAGAVEERKAALEERHGVRLELVFNPKAEEWNNAYSLWCAREHFARGVLLVNGDTVHPVSVEETLLASRGAPILLALDDAKTLGEEEMKVDVADGPHDADQQGARPRDGAGRVHRADADRAGGRRAALADALRATFERDPQLYYEDGFQEFADRGGHVGVAPIGEVAWVEVDDQRDLARAQEVACHC